MASYRRPPGSSHSPSPPMWRKRRVAYRKAVPWGHIFQAMEGRPQSPSHAALKAQGNPSFHPRAPPWREARRGGRPPRAAPRAYPAPRAPQGEVPPPTNAQGPSTPTGGGAPEGLGEDVAGEEGGQDDTLKALGPVKIWERGGGEAGSTEAVDVTTV